MNDDARPDDETPGDETPDDDSGPGAGDRFAPMFPGAIGVSHLRVYDTEAPDGQRGGTPHVHSVCTEAYAVIKGRGAVQTLTAGGFRETPIEAGSFVWFTPGTIHRLINLDGELEMFVIMQNAGLPEAGDLVLTFAPDILGDPVAYADASTLPPEGVTTAGSDAAARRRRDLAVEGFVQLRAAADVGDPGPLGEFYRASAEILRHKAAGWASIWATGPMLDVRQSKKRIDAIGVGAFAHLFDASVQALPPPPDERRMGCCGTLGTYVIPR